MAGKILTFLLMLLAAFLAFRWLRAAARRHAPPAPRQPASSASGAKEERHGEEKEVITLERDPETGVYRPRSDSRKRGS